MKIPYPLVTITVSASAAVAIVLASGACSTPSAGNTTGVTQTIGNRAVPIKDVAEFDKVFTAGLNKLISESGTAAARGRWVFTEHCGPNWCTRHWFSSELAKAMSRGELVKLRNQVGAELKTAASRQVALSEVAKGQISASFFVGSVHQIGKPAN